MRLRHKEAEQGRGVRLLIFRVDGLENQRSIVEWIPDSHGQFAGQHLFDQVANNLVDSVVRRAGEVYR